MSINSCTKAPENLLLYLPFSGDIIDKSENNFQVENFGAELCKNRYGEPNAAYQFDGKDDYMKIENFGKVLDSDEISVSMWVKSNTSKCQFEMMLVPDNNRFAISINFSHNGINTTFLDFGWPGCGGDCNGRLYFRPEPLDDEWHHYVFISKNSANERFMKIYKDGELINSKVEAMSLKDFKEKDLIIGGGEYECFFQGYLDDIRIYDKALTESEIKDISQ